MDVRVHLDETGHQSPAGNLNHIHFLAFADIERILRRNFGYPPVFHHNCPVSYRVGAGAVYQQVGLQN